MPRQNTIQTSWTKGEVSPLAQGRVDVNLYAAGAKTIENLIVRQQGAVFRRSGTKFIIEARDSSKASRLIPFEYSDIAGYQLLFGENYIWVFKDGSPVLDDTTNHDDPISAIGNSGGNYLVTVTTNSKSISTITNNGSGKTRCTTSTAHGYRTGSTVKITGTGYVSLDNLSFSVTFVSTTVFDITSVNFPGAGTGTAQSCNVRAGDPVLISGSVAAPTINGTWRVKSVAAFNQYVLAHSTYAAPGGGGSGTAFPWIVEIATTFLESELSIINYAQSADVMYLAHADHKPSKIQRYDDETWTLTDVVFKDGPYLPLQTLSFVDFTNPANGFQRPDVLWYINSYAHTATVKSNVVWPAGTAAAIAGGIYLEYRDGDQWRLAKLATATDGQSTGTVTIIDNVMLYMDESNKLSFGKSRNQMVAGSETNSGAFQPDYRGYTKTGQASTPSQKKIDPNNEVQMDGGALKSQYSGTFGIGDVGKYVRVHAASSAVGTWRQITGLVVNSNGQRANVSAALTMVGNNATGNFVISAHSRISNITAYEGQIDTVGFTGQKVIFSSNDVGRMVRMGFGGRWAWGRITALVAAVGNTSSIMTVSWEVDLPRDPHDAERIAGNHDTGALDTGWSYDWRMGAWGTEVFSGASYPTLHGPGYPKTVCFHEQRLTWGGTRWTPQTFWMSVSGDFENMIPAELDSTVLDDNAITYTLGSTKADAIRWMIGGASLVIGTSGNDWQIRAAESVNAPITPSNIQAKSYTANGTIATSSPSIIGSSVIFVDRSAKRLQELFYSFADDKVDTDDLSAISEHMLRDHDGAVSCAYQQNPNSVFWIVCDDGTLAGVTINKKQEIAGWHHHTIGSGSVESIAVIPSSDGTEDELWAVVNRTIGGSAKRTVERLEPDFYPASRTSKLGMRFPDGHLVVLNWTSTAIAGLNHLEGLSVAPVVDGVAQATKVVASGAITLDSAATSEVVIGIQSNADLESLPPEGGSQFGTSQGKVKRVVRVDFRWMDCISHSFGPDANHLTNQSLPVTSPNVWFRGTYPMLGSHGYDQESTWYLRQPNPYPLNVLFAVVTLETNE